MSRTIKVDLSGGAYEELEREAQTAGASPSEHAAAMLEKRFGKRGSRRRGGKEAQ